MVSATRKAFNEAFRSAADSGAKTFEFEGKSYTTKMAPPKTESNRGGARIKSGRDIMNTLPKVGKVETREIAPIFNPEDVSAVTGIIKKEQVRKEQESNPSDLVGKMAMKKGGIVTAKRTSNRGAGIAVKGFGRAGGR